MNKFQVFVIRAILGGCIAVFLTRMFYPNMGIQYAIGLGIILVGLAYFAEFLRQRKER